MTEQNKDRKSKIAKYIGENIYQYRKKKGYTREDLAEKSNLSANHIYELEMGNCMPTTITLIDICNALKVSLSQIIDTKLFIVEDVFKSPSSFKLSLYLIIQSLLLIGILSLIFEIKKLLIYKPSTPGL